MSTSSTPITRKRCAVYCRVSTDERLDQSFNSIDAQREAGQAFILAQRSEGWIPVADDYDDGGYSGGNMDRPALKRLMADIDTGKVDIIVVYKIDRLTRSLADFSKMVKVFDRSGASFSAVSQQINSATSMGRLMLNVLLSFAQFEREVNRERGRGRGQWSTRLCAKPCRGPTTGSSCWIPAGWPVWRNWRRRNVWIGSGSRRPSNWPAWLPTSRRTLPGVGDRWGYRWRSSCGRSCQTTGMSSGG